MTLPITLFSIPLGLAGVGGAWSAADDVLGAARLPGQLAYGSAVVVWAAFMVVYVLGTITHESASFHLHLRHPLSGPLTAYIPVIAMLVVGHYAAFLGGAARWLTYVALGALFLNAAALFAHWLKFPLDQDAIHPGYFLPVTAGPFIASIGLVSVGDTKAAVAVFGVGIYFWILLGAVITARLFFGSPLPDRFRPVLSILLSPPGTASLAWFAISRGRVDDLQVAIGGVTVFLLLIQMFFLADYLSLPFTAQHWVFTFPLAVLGNMGVRWAGSVGGSAWEGLAWTVLALTTALILAIAAGTVRDVLSWFAHRASKRRLVQG